MMIPSPETNEDRIILSSIPGRFITRLIRQVRSHPRVIDEILRYIQTGSLQDVNRNYLRFIPEQQAENRLLVSPRSKNILTVIDGIVRTPNAVLPFVEEAHVSFRLLPDLERIDFAGIDPQSITIGQPGLRFVFTSALSFVRNFRDFTQYVESAYSVYTDVGRLQDDIKKYGLDKPHSIN